MQFTSHRRLTACLAAAVTMSLAACDTAGTVKTINDIGAKVAQVQSYATQLCSYLPTAATVVGIFNSGFAGDVAAVGSAICNAVTTRPLAEGPGDRVPRVNGVVVKGRFVQ